VEDPRNVPRDEVPETPTDAEELERTVVEFTVVTSTVELLRDTTKLEDPEKDEVDATVLEPVPELDNDVPPADDEDVLDDTIGGIPEPGPIRVAPHAAGLLVTRPIPLFK
jgi:hypothetical protein